MLVNQPAIPRATKNVVRPDPIPGPVVKVEERRWRCNQCGERNEANVEFREGIVPAACCENCGTGHLFEK